MRGEVIALDLETTGLDVENDHIIEVGIALCRDDEVIKTYQTLVKPPVEIPFKVTSITHISNEDVKDAPVIAEVLEQIREFIGDRPIIGHNIDFDVNVLARHGVAGENPRIDTYELAAVLMPTATRYNLGSLVENFNLTLENAHRALDDAIASWQVYRHLWQMIFKLPLNVLEEILQNAEPMEWQAKQSLQDAYQMRLADGEQSTGRAEFSHLYQSLDQFQTHPPLTPKESPDEVDVHSLSEWLEAGGRVSQHLEGFKQREGQLSMLQMVGTAFNRDRHLILEAPAGLGKSLAYLLPAAQVALQNQTRVVIATHDRHTQEALVSQQIPFLQEQLGLPIRAVEVYGRNNYLCLRRLEQIRERKVVSLDELRILAKVLVWLSEGGTGIKGDLNLRGHAEHQMWNRFSAQEGPCNPDTCKRACPLFIAQHQAESAHLILVRDTLLFADILADDPIIPAYDYLIIDEAHHLEDSITNSLEQRIDRNGVVRRLGELGNLESGLLGEILTILEPILPANRYEKIRAFTGNIAEALPDLQRRMARLFDDLPQMLREIFDLGDYIGNQRITADLRQHGNWQRLIRHWERNQEHLAALAEALGKLAGGMTNAIPADSPHVERVAYFSSMLTNAARYLEGAHQRLGEAIQTPQSHSIYWVEVSLDYEHIVFHSAPLSVTKFLAEHFWEAKSSVVLISPTLRVSDSFDYIDERWDSANHADHAYVESPFDYPNDALLYLVNDIKEPNERQDYQIAMEQGILDIAAVTEGKLLVLFTSVGQLRETLQNIGKKLEDMGITVIDESTSGGRRRVLDDFINTEKAILMGASNFWESIDIPDHLLKVVAIAKMPFEVPSNPIFAARGEIYGTDQFLEYGLPDAILRFRQGFDRLIRRQGDRGVVVVFDRRMISKKYGKHFVESLPNATVEKGSRARLRHAVRDWLDKE